MKTIIMILILTVADFASASINMKVSRFLSEAGHEYNDVSAYIDISKHLREKEFPNEKDKAYLLCVKGDLAMMSKVSYGKCINIVDGTYKQIHMSGFGASLNISGGVALIIYDDHKEFKDQFYEDGFGLAGAGLTTGILKIIGKTAMKLGKTRLGVGLDLAYTSNDDFGSLFLIGAQLGAGFDISIATIVISDI